MSKSLTQSSQRKISAPSVVVASVSSNGRPADRNVSVLMENTLKEMRENAPSSSSAPSQVTEIEPASTVGGGVEDVYGEDTATEDQYITPWTVTVAR